MSVNRGIRNAIEPAGLILAVAGLAACAMMGGIAGRTAEEPARAWVPPAREAAAVEPLAAPSVPPELMVPGRVWTLADIVDVGLSNNPRTRAAWHAARAASAAVGIALGAYLPTVDMTLEATKQKAAFAGGRFIIQQTTLTPSAALSLLLFDFGGREASVAAARRALDAANWTHNAVLQNTILGIESAYYQYLSARALLEAQLTNRRGAQANYDAADARHRAGVATIADVLQAKNALSAVDLGIVTTRGLIQTLHGSLANAMGLPANAGFEVVEGLPEEVPVEAVARQVDLCIMEAEAMRPDLAAARAQVLGAEATVRKARASFFPTLSLSGNIGRIYYKGSSVSNPFYAISVTLDLPFLFGLQQYAVQAAKAEADLARDQMTDLGRGIELQVWTSYYGLKTSAQMIASAKDLVESAQASYDVALGRYKEGVGSILDLLAAQAALEGGRVQLVQAKSDWFQAVVQFAHDTGTLGAPPAPGGPAAPPSPLKGDRRP